MITSARQSSWPLDWPLEDLEAAGLPQPCLVRFKLFTLDERLVSGGLGVLAAADRAGVETQVGKLLPTATRSLPRPHGRGGWADGSGILYRLYRSGIRPAGIGSTAPALSSELKCRGITAIRRGFATGADAADETPTW